MLKYSLTKDLDQDYTSTPLFVLFSQPHLSLSHPFIPLSSFLSIFPFISGVAANPRDRTTPTPNFFLPRNQDQPSRTTSTPTLHQHRPTLCLFIKPLNTLCCGMVCPIFCIKNVIKCLNYQCEKVIAS